MGSQTVDAGVEAKVDGVLVVLRGVLKEGMKEPRATEGS